MPVLTDKEKKELDRWLMGLVEKSVKGIEDLFPLYTAFHTSEHRYCMNLAFSIMKECLKERPDMGYVSEKAHSILKFVQKNDIEKLLAIELY